MSGFSHVCIATLRVTFHIYTAMLSFVLPFDCTFVSYILFTLLKDRACYASYMRGRLYRITVGIPKIGLESGKIFEGVHVLSFKVIRTNNRIDRRAI